MLVTIHVTTKLCVLILEIDHLWHDRIELHAYTYILKCSSKKICLFFNGLRRTVDRFHRFGYVVVQEQALFFVSSCFRFDTKHLLDQKQISSLSFAFNFNFFSTLQQRKEEKMPKKKALRKKREHYKNLKQMDLLRSVHNLSEKN